MSASSKSSWHSCAARAPRDTLWDGYRALELVHATRHSLTESLPVAVPLDLD